VTERETRYSRHVSLAGIGREGQDSIRRGTAAIIGLGGLGGTASILLARAGAGTLRLVDPDRVDWTNMQRQSLYDESDAERGVQKAEAAARHLSGINSEVRYEPVTEGLNPSNAERIVRGATVVVDCLDNFHDRALLNQACVKLGVPLVHGACVSAHGTVTTILPGDTPCYACIVPDAATREAPYTSATVGVFAPAVFAVASFEAAEALKVLTGRKEALLSGRMLWIDVWEGEVRSFTIRRDPGCPVCGRHEYTLLQGS
jgi:adenylyltransferase/sulfurtransferase